MRRARANKTRKAVAKRFKITATGKVLRSQSGKRHLLESKSSKRRRNLRGTTELSDHDTRRVKENLPFSNR